MTGVQTCALPIWSLRNHAVHHWSPATASGATTKVQSGPSLLGLHWAQRGTPRVAIGKGVLRVPRGSPRAGGQGGGEGESRGFPHILTVALGWSQASRSGPPQIHGRLGLGVSMPTVTGGHPTALPLWAPESPSNLWCCLRRSTRPHPGSPTTSPRRDRDAGAHASPSGLMGTTLAFRGPIKSLDHSHAVGHVTRREGHYPKGPGLTSPV